MQKKSYLEDMQANNQQKTLGQGAQKVDEKELRKSIHSQVVRQFQWHFLSKKIVEVENILVIDADIEKYITTMAKLYKQDPQRKTNQIMNDEKQREDLRSKILNDKIFAHLASKMKLNQNKIAYNKKSSSQIVTE